MEAGIVTSQPEIATAGTAESRATATACRALDLVGAALLLVLLAPLFGLLAVAVAVDSPGRPIFRQRRIGRGGRPFTVNKFRTMHVEASQDTHRDFVLQLIAADSTET